MAAHKIARKNDKLGKTQRRNTAKDLTEGRSIQEPGKHHMIKHKMQEKVLRKMKHSKEDLKSAAKHMKAHGG